MKVDDLISFAIIMMMLSFVAERISNFLKLYFQDKKVSILCPHKSRRDGLWKLGFKTEIKILAYKQPTVATEKQREQRIMIINIIIGVLIAAITNANFFEILDAIADDEAQNAIKGWDWEKLKQSNISIRSFWLGALYLLSLLWAVSLMFFNRLFENKERIEQHYTYIPFALIFLTTIGILLFAGQNEPSNFVQSLVKIAYHSIGFIITGVFLSLGSKFWHDFLDILFSYKNVRQHLSEKGTFTDYHSADQILTLTETSWDDVAQQLYEKYSATILTIDGVVSCGVNLVLDPITSLQHKRMIEVEYSSGEAANTLLKLKQEGTITVNHNTFYLKDFLHLLHTESLIAAPFEGQDMSKKSPKCFAYNINSSDVKGSFGVLEKNGEYFAISNLHVFAAKTEFKHFKQNDKYQLTHRKVRFVIGNKKFYGLIQDGYKLGMYNGYGYDYCVCSIKKKVYDAFHELIDDKQTIPNDDSEMKMFGAVSKYKNFYPYRRTTFCRIKYPDFTRELYLLKISTSDVENIQKGDSGSVVTFRITERDNTHTFLRGMLVAKSDHYAYMFQVTD